jgi:hypothetical protein
MPVTPIEQNPFNNPEFRKELSELLDEKLIPIVTKVEDHERAIQRARGASWLLGVLWTIVMALAEWLFHKR